MGSIDRTEFVCKVQSGCQHGKRPPVQTVFDAPYTLSCNSACAGTEAKSGSGRSSRCVLHKNPPMAAAECLKMAPRFRYISAIRSQRPAQAGQVPMSLHESRRRTGWSCRRSTTIGLTWPEVPRSRGHRVGRGSCRACRGGDRVTPRKSTIMGVVRPTTGWSSPAAW